MFKTLHLHCRGHTFDPHLGNRIHMLWGMAQKKKKKIEKKRNYLKIDKDLNTRA